MGAAYLVIDNLSKRYDSKSVIDVEKLSIDRGEVVAIIGPNGSGKSTMLRLIAHLERPSAGSIRFNGDAQGVSDIDIRRRLAMVFQEPLLFSGTVYDNIAYGLRLRKMPQAEIDRKVRDMAGLLGISHLLERPSGKISGGEAQRTSLARALILEPELLLLDEPMASLDPPTREALLTDLDRILTEFKMTVVYVTHELTEAVILADRWVFMDKGSVVQVGTPNEVMEQPVNQKVADFVGVENIIAGVVSGASDGLVRVRVDGTELEVVGKDTLNGKIWVLIRPENVTIATEKSAQKTSARNSFTGVIERILDLGMFYRVVVDCGFLLYAFVTKQSAEEMGLRVGDRVWATFKATAAHVISGEHPIPNNEGKEEFIASDLYEYRANR